MPSMEDAGIEEHSVLEDLKIRHAIAKFKEPPINHTAICAHCGEPISLDRLKANPRAVHCIDCASELETLRSKRAVLGPFTNIRQFA